MQFSSTFIRTSGPITEVKKSALINDWENIAYWDKSQQSKALAKNLGLFQMQFGVWGVAQPQENFTIFTLIETETKLSYKYERFFSIKPGNLIINWVTLFLQIPISLL